MNNPSLQISRNACFLVIAGFILASSANHLGAQQHVINKKDVTRPETSRQFNSFNLSSFTPIQENGYNEIRWTAPSKKAGKKIVIEYSFDGINFLSGPEVSSGDGMFNYKHQMQDTRPILYRLRTEEVTGAVSFSGAFLPKGITVSPVQVQSNIVTGNVINATAQFPVERVTVVSGDGAQLLSKDMNGLRDFVPVAIPSLKQGIYFITFYGNGWKSTSRFMIG
jgi:hypothetical protein